MKNILLAAVFSFIGFTAQAAHAPTCAPILDVLSELADKYNEQVVASGKSSSNDNVILILQEPTGKTWSILVFEETSGEACLKASGIDFKFYKEGELI